MIIKNIIIEWILICDWVRCYKLIGIRQTEDR